MRGAIRQAGSPLAPAADQTVRLLRGGALVGEAKSDATGLFEIKNVEPGVHAFVAYGEFGRSVVGVELTAAVPRPGQALFDTNDGKKFVSLLQDANDESLFVIQAGTNPEPDPNPDPTPVSPLVAGGGGGGDDIAIEQIAPTVEPFIVASPAIVAP